ncbi:ATP-binding protein [Corynebacterium sp.]|uniref:ATP-binding protein n=1 Tax=Corynebacterium sp. TaxID=1720 RepID=UPI0026E02B32|nr:ATP-binding protein [Corynebacterium sp.]MDO5512519.1 ATP-binding protein [Corynebacterium sp.]
MVKKNPFRAGLGVDPPVLVGRADDLEDFGYALETGPGAHERISVVTGARGVGKTVLLNALQRVALEHGWLYFSETATPGFVQRLVEAVQRAHGQLVATEKHRLSGVSVAGWGVEWDNPGTSASSDLRQSLTVLLDALEDVSRVADQEPTGVLITLDELHQHSRDDVIQLATVIQHLVREDRQIALVMAGIPSAVKPLLASNENANPITFIRRAHRISLGSVGDEDVQRALEEPVRLEGMAWDPSALSHAVFACGGYPFLIQLVGYWSFRYAGDSDEISTDAAERGVVKARRTLGQLVHEPAVDDLSDVDRTFLAYMTKDRGPSRVADIAQRMGVSPQYAWNYRRRLLDAEMIEDRGNGSVDYTLPYMRDYLREHVVSDVIAGINSDTQNKQD